MKMYTLLERYASGRIISETFCAPDDETALARVFDATETVDLILLSEQRLVYSSYSMNLSQMQLH